jgi:hypothetical protein
MGTSTMLLPVRNGRRTSTNQWKDFFRLHPIFAVGVIIGVVLILAIVGMATYWWLSIPHDPKRPATVPKEAVWIGIHKGGEWTLCGVKEYGDTAQCTMWGWHGTLDYQGDFKTYKESPLSPNKRLDINTQLSSTKEVFIHGEFVPIIYLTNHKILIPAEAYSRVIDENKGSVW